MKLKKFVTCMKQKKRGLGSVVFMFATLLLQACLAISTPFIKATKTTSNVIHILFARLTQCVVELVSICFGLLARSRPSICSMPVSFPRRCSGTLYYSQHWAQYLFIFLERSHAARSFQGFLKSRCLNVPDVNAFKRLASPKKNHLVHSRRQKR